MSVATVAPHAPSSNTFHHHMDPSMSTGSPTAQRKQHNKAPRSKQNIPSAQHNTGAQSDSNLPSTTPRSKKQRNRQPDNRAASNGEAHTQPRQSRPVPMGSPVSHATPIKAAYAGPTFHQSPAASSLPVPKFFSKSVPAPGPDTGFQARLDKETSKPASPSPLEGTTPAPPLSRERSPLDVFFDKDREERSKRPGSSALRDVQNADGTEQVRQFSQQENSPFIQNRKVSPSDTSKGLFDLELDGSQSPAVRRSARPSPAPRMSSAPNGMSGQNNPEAARATHDLKALLFQSAGLTTPQRPAPQAQDPSLTYGNRNLSPMFHAARNGSPSHQSPAQQGWPQHQQQQQQSPFLSRNNQSAYVTGPPQQNPDFYNQRGVSGVQTSQTGSSDVKDMEAKLRGILKLGP